MATVKVIYWVGTSQKEEVADSYEAAMAIADKNQNAYDPTFFEVSSGRKLFDHGDFLGYESESGEIVAVL